jgi:hypothetical protein
MDPGFVVPKPSNFHKRRKSMFLFRGCFDMLKQFWIALSLIVGMLRKEAYISWDSFNGTYYILMTLESVGITENGQIDLKFFRTVEFARLLVLPNQDGRVEKRNNCHLQFAFRLIIQIDHRSDWLL